MKQFFTLILALLFFAFLLRVDFIFYIVYVCLGIYIWGRWVTPHLLAALKIERVFHDHAFWGETIPVTLKFHNGSRLSLPWVQFYEEVAFTLRTGDTINHVTSFARQETTTFTYTVRGRRRGYYQLGPLQVRTGDLFGLYNERVVTLPAHYFTVYPRLIPLTQLGLPSRLPFGTVQSHQRLFADPARPMGVRDYQSGDSLRQINWKVSAHTRHLMVKTFQPAISLETAVLLNLHLDDYARQERQNTIEWAIVVAASLAAHLIDRRQAVGLITNGIDPLATTTAAHFDEESGRLSVPQPPDGPKAAVAPPLPPRSGRGSLMKILERLARIEAEDTITFTQWATNACLPLSWGVTILAITATGDEATCQTLHRLVRTGFNPILIAVEKDHNFGRVEERAQRLGFAAYHVAHLPDLDTWRQPLRRTG